MSRLHKINIRNLHTDEHTTLLAEAKHYLLSPERPEDDTHSQWIAFKGKALKLNLESKPFSIDFMGQSARPKQNFDANNFVRSSYYDIHVEDFAETREQVWQFFLSQLYKICGHETLTHDRFTSLCESLISQNGLSHQFWESYFNSFRLQLLGLGPLEEFLSDESITEILVQGTELIRIERNGQLESTSARFSTLDELKFTCDKCSQFIEMSFSRAQPICEGSWRGGQRIEIVHSSLAPSGPILCVRKYKPSMQNLARWLETGGLTPAQNHWLHNAAHASGNVISIDVA